MYRPGKHDYRTLPLPGPGIAFHTHRSGGGHGISGAIYPLNPAGVLVGYIVLLGRNAIEQGSIVEPHGGTTSYTYGVNIGQGLHLSPILIVCVPNGYNLLLLRRSTNHPIHYQSGQGMMIASFVLGDIYVAGIGRKSSSHSFRGRNRLGRSIVPVIPYLNGSPCVVHTHIGDIPLYCDGRTKFIGDHVVSLGEGSTILSQAQKGNR